MSKIAVIAKLTAAEGKRDDLVAAMGPMMTAAEAEVGTEVYALHNDLGDENTVWIYELYTDNAALDAHSSSEAMAAFGASLGDLLGGALEITLLEPVSDTGL